MASKMKKDPASDVAKMGKADLIRLVEELMEQNKLLKTQLELLEKQAPSPSTSSPLAKSAKMGPLDANLIEVIALVVDQALEKCWDKRKREKNCVVFSLAERGQSEAEIDKADTELVNKVLDEVQIPRNRLEYTARVGKKSSQKPRVLKVRFLGFHKQMGLHSGLPPCSPTFLPGRFQRAASKAIHSTRFDSRRIQERL